MRRAMSAAVATALIATLAFVTSSEATGPTFTKPITVGAGPSEPGIHIGADGVIYVDGPTGTPGHSNLYKSTDGGASFSQVFFTTGMNRLPGGGDSDVVLRGNKIYFLDLWAGSNSISVSQDAGATWTTGNPFTTLPVSDRQWIELGEANALGLDTVYALYNNFQTGNMIAKSSTGGVTWDYHGYTGGSGPPGQLQSDGKNQLAYMGLRQGSIYSYVSTNGGANWRNTRIAGNVFGIIPGSAMDGMDLYAAWTNTGDYATNIAVSHDLGLTWSSPRKLSAPGGSTVFPWVEARNGKVAVVWYGSDKPGKPDDVPAETEWNVYYTESLDRGSTWTTPVNAGFARKDFICTRGLACSPTLGGPGHRELGDFLSVTLDGSGKSHIVWVRVPSSIRYVKQL